MKEEEARVLLPTSINWGTTKLQCVEPNATIHNQIMIISKVESPILSVYIYIYLQALYMGTKFAP